jgi:hydroxymethylpyrimidine pyrophosphatase-like HAD family hydrolase
MRAMRYKALATDYDGTLATDGVVDRDTVQALRKLAATGRKLILITGRQLEDLLRVFPDARIFDRIVAENGAIAYEPSVRRTRLLTEGPPRRFLEELQRRGVAPLYSGRVVVATVQPNDAIVAKVIAELGLPLDIILNKEAVMVLPRGVDKASGLAAALEELALSPRDVVGIGDAENDQAFLAMCGCGIAVANALDTVKKGADRVTQGRAGAGVCEVIDGLIADDLSRQGG